MHAASGEGRGPGGCPPGITQPTVVPTVGAGAWQCAQKLGSHDECLGGRVYEVTEIFDGHKSLQAAALSAAGLARAIVHAGVGEGGSLLVHDRAHPFPSSPQTLLANSFPSTPEIIHFPQSIFLPRPHRPLAC